MQPHTQTDRILPLPLPDDPIQRLTLVCLRRMAAHGIRDASAALLMLNRFGINFRRPLVLLRAFMTELAQASTRTITIAPCCVMRMTIDEGRLVGVLATAASNPRCAERHLALLTQSDATGSPLSLAAAYNSTLAELGHPLAL